MKDKYVCFAGHKEDFYNIGIREKLESIIQELICREYLNFYVSEDGYFDKIVEDIIFKLKKSTPNLKIIKVLACYRHDITYGKKLKNYDDTIYPNLEMYYPREKISKKNEWLVNNSDILVCHIEKISSNYAYRTLKYAKKNKPIYYI